jgi:hypothetical protein
MRLSWWSLSMGCGIAACGLNAMALAAPDQVKRQVHGPPLPASPVYRWFTGGFDPPVLKEAKALLDELSGTPVHLA